MNIPFEHYQPSERFAQYVNTELALKMWTTVSRPESIQKMTQAISEGLPAVTYLDSELHECFSEVLKTQGEHEPELRILCMNMMKQLLEQLGYEHSACAICPEGKFVKSAGIFTKKV